MSLHTGAHTRATHGAHTRCSHTVHTHGAHTHTGFTHGAPVWKALETPSRKLKSSSEKMTPRTARPLQRMRVTVHLVTRFPRATGAESNAHRWGPQAGFGSHGSPGPQREEQRSAGAPPDVAIPAQPGGGEEGRAPVPRAAEVPCPRPRRRPGIHGTRSPARGAAAAALRRASRATHPRCREKQTTPPPSSHTGSAQRSPCRPARTAKAPVTFCRRARIRRPKQSPRCEPAPRSAPENPSCLFRGGPRPMVGEQLLSWGALKPRLERN